MASLRDPCCDPCCEPCPPKPSCGGCGGPVISDLLTDLQCGKDWSVQNGNLDGGYCIKFDSSTLPPICKPPKKEQLIEELVACTGTECDVEQEVEEEVVVEECEKPQVQNPFEGMDRSLANEKALLVMLTGDANNLMAVSTEIEFLARHLGLSVRYNSPVH